MFRLLCVFVLSYIVGSEAGVVSFITPCKHDDKACLKTSAQHAVKFIVEGIPDLGIPSSDPLDIKEVKSDEGDLKIYFRDMKLEGLKKCQFTTIEFTSESNLAFSVDCPILAHGKYKLDGKLLGVELFGDGDFEIKTDKVKLDIKATFDKVTGSDGKEHWSIKSLEKSYDPVEQVHFKFTNLFNGDEAKAKPILDILQASWKPITLSVGEPIIVKLVNKVKEDVNKFFVGVPLDELVL